MEKVVRLEVASEKDDQALEKFTANYVTHGLVDVRTCRPHSYFAPYQLQSDQYRTYLLRHRETSEILATATFTSRDTWLNNQNVRIAHAVDLRVAPNRAAIMEWTHHFLPVIEQVKKEMDVRYLFSSINAAETKILNTFIRPRKIRRPLPRYFLYRKFYLNTLHGRFPWAPPPLKSLRIREASEALWPQLAEYIVRRSQYRPFTSIHDAETLRQKMSRFPGLKLSDFRVAFDAYDNIVGCMAPWSPKDTQEWRPLSFSLRAHNFRQFLKFGKLLGWTRPLTKPVASTGVEAPFRFQFLTHLHADNEDVFESLLWDVFEKISPDEFLIYAQVEQDYRLLPPRSWISASLPYSLYSILDPNEEMPEFLHPSYSMNPEIEAAFTL